MANCTLCPLECGIDRTTKAGACGETDRIRIAKYGLHPFEEPCISCKNGSGTIFFCGCSLRCVFCQNYSLSRSETGKEISPEKLAGIFRELEEIGAENINLVTASHFVPQLIRAFQIYRPNIPVVYNTHAYEKTEALKALDRFVDIWLPDLKYFSPKVSFRYTSRSDYFEYASRAVSFMAQRTPVFKDGKMLSGCIVRHLVLPLNTNDSISIIDWFASLHSSAYFSLMGQYTPCGQIEKFPELKRKLTKREYNKVLDYALSADLPHLFAQELSAADQKFIPNFSENSPDLFP